jgi:hypothetical protein
MLLAPQTLLPRCKLPAASAMALLPPSESKLHALACSTPSCSGAASAQTRSPHSPPPPPAAALQPSLPPSPARLPARWRDHLEHGNVRVLLQHSPNILRERLAKLCHGRPHHQHILCSVAPHGGALLLLLLLLLLLPLWPRGACARLACSRAALLPPGSARKGTAPLQPRWRADRWAGTPLGVAAGRPLAPAASALLVGRRLRLPSASKLPLRASREVASRAAAACAAPRVAAFARGALLPLPLRASVGPQGDLLPLKTLCAPA